MQFNANSGLVQVWAGLIRAGIYRAEQVPALGNLQEIVAQVLAA